MPTIRALECLVAVVESGSITAAAQRLHASQPAVSHQLAVLERELGVPLVERLPRGVRLTVAGRAVLQHARIAIDANEHVLTTGRSIARGHSGTLRIGCAASLMVTVLPPVISRWRIEHPGIELHISEADSADDLDRRLAAGRIDLALTPEPSTTGHRRIPIGTEPVMVAMAWDHPFVGESAVPVAELNGRDAVMYGSGHGLGAWIDGQLSAHGVAVRPVVHTRQILAAAQLAAAGAGIAFVPQTALPAGFTGVLVPLAPMWSRQIVALTGGGDDPVTKRFVDDLRARGVGPTPRGR